MMVAFSCSAFFLFLASAPPTISLWPLRCADWLALAVSVDSSLLLASTCRHDRDGNARQRSSRLPLSLVWLSIRRREIHGSRLLWLTTRGSAPSARLSAVGVLLLADALRGLRCLLLVL